MKIVRMIAIIGFVVAGLVLLAVPSQCADGCGVYTDALYGGRRGHCG